MSRLLPKTESLRWFHATRFLGVSTILYGLLVDKTPERGSIILGGFGLLGLEKVARGEEASTAKDKRKEIQAKEGESAGDSSTRT